MLLQFWNYEWLITPFGTLPSPIQVLTGPNVALLARSNGMAYFQRGMVVSDVCKLHRKHNGAVYAIIANRGSAVRFPVVTCVLRKSNPLAT